MEAAVVQSMIKAAVVGGSGYVGGELIRLLLSHPQVTLSGIYGLGSVGEEIYDLHPALRGFTDLAVQALPASVDEWPEFDVIFLSLPHGESMKLVPRLPEESRVIDLSGDFRVRDSEVFERYYGFPHAAGDWHGRFTYGLTELFSGQVKESRLIANPGCFATACLLGVAPLAKAGIVEPHVVIDAKTGSSGSGIKPQKGTHHPERTEGFLAYKMFRHQHQPEIAEALGRFAPSWNGKVTLQAHSAPMVRGIFASIYTRLLPGFTGLDVTKALADVYQGAPFIRHVEGSPNVRWVKGTNFADLGFAVDGQDLALFVAIDNLGKGAAGQALQNMNLMFGLSETSGLWHVGMIP
jgi:N-acetyl-gamma-glutamyl-phosphate reductase